MLDELLLSVNYHNDIGENKAAQIIIQGFHW